MWRAGGSGLRGPKGAIEHLSTASPPDSVVCLDEMGPEAAKSFQGHTLIHVTARPAERSRQEIDDGRRASGYVFGAFQPSTGVACAGTAPRRTTPHHCQRRGVPRAR